MQRAKLLLTLKAMSTGPGKGTPGGMNLLAVCTNGQQQESKVRSVGLLSDLCLIEHAPNARHCAK